jgi:predicted transcriptional regulator
MACIDADGTLTLTGKFLLKSLVEGPMTPQEIGKAIGEPVFKVRGSLRELDGAGFIREDDGVFHITEEGRAKL